MSRAEFLARLRQGLAGLPAAQSEEIIGDYATHFDEALAAGRSEEEVAAALGDPQRLARELRAEAGLRRWETHRTPGALIAAIVSLGGLLALDVLILLPILTVIAILAFAGGITLVAIGIAGLAVLLSGLFHGLGPAGVAGAASRVLAGVGLLAGSIGFAAVGWLVLEGIVRLLGNYARLHYRVLKPVAQPQ
jgi:uncharacterized membrane protein